MSWGGRRRVVKSSERLNLENVLVKGIDINIRFKSVYNATTRKPKLLLVQVRSFFSVMKVFIV